MNSTFAGNYALYGGAIRAGQTSAPVTILNSTIALNESAEGGGVMLNQSGTTITLHNSIVADNIATAAASTNDVWGTLNSQCSFSLFGSGSGGTNLTATQLHNIIGSANSPIDPLLTPLGQFGGRTETLALLPSSPAINAGDESIPLPGIPGGGGANIPLEPYAVDQRGGTHQRVRSSHVDMGAVEANVVQATPTSSIYVYGTDSPEAISINSTYEGDSVTFSFAPDFAFPLSLSSASTVSIDCYEGDDSVNVSATVSKSVTVYGGKGDDAIIGGGGNDTLYGDDGDDWLRGEAGNDWLSGEDDVDRLDGGTGQDVYYVDPDDDYLNDVLMDSDQALAVQNASGHVNHAPTVTPVANMSVAVGRLIEFDIVAQAGDGGQSLTFSAALPRGARLTSAGHFSWTPDYDQVAGNQIITVAAKDNDSSVPLQTTSTIAIAVTPADPHSGETLFTFAPSFEINVGEQYAFRLRAASSSDREDQLNFNLVSPSNFASVSSDGKMTWGGAPAGTYTLTVNAAGPHSSLATRDITVTVRDINLGVPFGIGFSHRTIISGGNPNPEWTDKFIGGDLPWGIQLVSAGSATLQIDFTDLDIATFYLRVQDRETPRANIV